MKINIGTCNQYIKSIKLDKIYPSDTKCILYWHPYGDTFNFYFVEDILFIERTDCESGWCYEHNIYILETENNQDQEINININSNTILLVEPRFLEDLDQIIIDSIKKLGENWIFVFYCYENTIIFWKDLLKGYNIEYRGLKVNNFPQPALYSNFMKSLNLWTTLYGTHVLTIQADCWILNQQPYDIDYFINLNKSFIGGNMNYIWHELIKEKIFFNFYNFNGGLSLRNIQDMIKIISTFPPKELTSDTIDNFETFAEDVYFTIGCHKLNLNLGNDEESSNFACHTIYNFCFGFHQPCNAIKNEINKDYPLLKYQNKYLQL